jgi:hypothetical protein
MMGSRNCTTVSPSDTKGVRKVLEEFPGLRPCIGYASKGA